jgi:hypothetical protein
MNPDTLFILRLILATLTCFRVAQLVTLDKGPFLIFERLRLKVENHIAASKARKQSYFWRSVADGTSCPYCLGFYTSLLCTLLIIFPTQAGDLFLLWFGIMGLQAFLQGLTDEGEPRN